MRFTEQFMATKMVKAGLDVIICGGPGTGKTWFLQNILPDVAKNHLHKSVYYTATTGVVASMLPDGITIDMLYVRNNKRLPYNCVIVIDECSMLSSTMWKALLDARKHRNIQFILVGDLDQLSPVSTPAFYRLDAWRQYWQRTTLAIRFTTQKRIEPEDMAYYKFMEDIRYANTITPHMRHMLQDSHDRATPIIYFLTTTKLQRVKKREKGIIIPEIPQSTLQNILFVCGQVKDVLKMNTRMLHIIQPSEHMITKITQPDGNPLCISIGCPVMVTENIYKRSATGKSCLYVANGMTGIVRGISQNKKIVTISSSTDASKTYEIERVVPFGKTRNIMPLILFFATTVHKLQGCTLHDNNILVADMNIIKGFWDKKQVYVALSRGKRWNQMCLRNVNYEQLEKFMRQPRIEYEQGFIEEFDYHAYDSNNYIFDVYAQKRLTRL